MLFVSFVVPGSAPLRLHAQQRGGRGGAPPGPPPTGQGVAPVDLTGYWVSLIVDEWRFRVSPQKGDIAYLPLNAEARQVANAWDPAKGRSGRQACKAYGAVGVMQRPGRLHITWDNPNTLKIEADAGTQTRTIHFGPPPPAQRRAAVMAGLFDRELAGERARADRHRRNRLRAGAASERDLDERHVDRRHHQHAAGYIRKNGVPYSDKAVLTEHVNRLTGQQNDAYLSVTAMVDDPTYLTQPFVRTYTFKKQADASGWDPTPCWNR